MSPFDFNSSEARSTLSTEFCVPDHSINSCIPRSKEISGENSNKVLIFEISAKQWRMSPFLNLFVTFGAMFLPQNPARTSAIFLTVTGNPGTYVQCLIICGM